MSDRRARLVDGEEGPQVQRTKAALRGAFVELVLARRYDKLRVGDIVERAGVSRSTFYEHYNGKDDLLQEGLAGPFGVLADILSDRHDPAQLLATVEHFWENCWVANTLFGGRTRPVVVRTLATLVEARLSEPARLPDLPLPPRLLAAQIAGGQIGLLSAWLAGLGAATPAAIAAALRAAALASARPPA